MTGIAMDYPLGRALLPSVLVRRERALPPNAQLAVGVGDQVHPAQALAETPEGAPLVIAGLAARVIEALPGQRVTLEGAATVIAGLVGVGGAVVGPLTMLPRGESLAVVPIPRAAILFSPQPISLTLLQRAVAGGALGVIAPSASVRELESFLRTDLTALLDGRAATAPRPPLTILLTEGLGERVMRQQTFQAFVARLNETILLTGHTDPHANIRPEALLPLPLGAATLTPPVESALLPGARVAVVAGPLQGAQGEMLQVFPRRLVIESGVSAPCAQVRLDDGGLRVLPLGALERIG